MLHKSSGERKEHDKEMQGSRERQEGTKMNYIYIESFLQQMSVGEVTQECWNG